MQLQPLHEVAVYTMCYFKTDPALVLELFCRLAKDLLRQKVLFVISDQNVIGDSGPPHDL